MDKQSKSPMARFAVACVLAQTPLSRGKANVCEVCTRHHGSNQASPRLDATIRAPVALARSSRTATWRASDAHRSRNHITDCTHLSLGGLPVAGQVNYQPVEEVMSQRMPTDIEHVCVQCGKEVRYYQKTDHGRGCDCGECGKYSPPPICSEKCWLEHSGETAEVETEEVLET